MDGIPRKILILYTCKSSCILIDWTKYSIPTNASKSNASTPSIFTYRVCRGCEMLSRIILPKSKETLPTRTLQCFSDRKLDRRLQAGYPIAVNREHVRLDRI